MKNLPEGFEIVTNGKVFRWRLERNGYMSLDRCSTIEGIIDSAWIFYNYDKEEKEYSWKKVELITI